VGAIVPGLLACREIQRPEVEYGKGHTRWGARGRAFMSLLLRGGGGGTMTTASKMGLAVLVLAVATGSATADTISLSGN
jgi:hypothetical protein